MAKDYCWIYGHIDVDVEDYLFNGQMMEVPYIDVARNIVEQIYVKFSDPQAGLKALTASYLSRQNS